jgi:hypothetical protein
MNIITRVEHGITLHKYKFKKLSLVCETLVSSILYVCKVLMLRHKYGSICLNVKTQMD